MTTTWVDTTIQGAGFLAEGTLLFVVFWRARWRTLPIFTAAAVFAPFEDGILNVASRTATKHTYFLAFWALAAVDYLIQLMLIVEIARNVLRPARTWVPGAQMQFALWSMVGAASVLGIVLFSVKPPGNSANVFYVQASLFTSMLTCVCFLALTLIANRFCLPRRDHTKAIGQGLALWNVACVIGDVSRSTGVSGKVVAWLDYTRMSLWVVVLLYWAKSLWAQERGKSSVLCGADLLNG